MPPVLDARGPRRGSLVGLLAVVTIYPRILTWRRLGPVGVEQVLFRDQVGLTSEGLRRLQLLAAPVGTVHRLAIVFVRVSSLEAVPRQQMYTTLGDGRIGYASRERSTVLEMTPDGFVADYPGWRPAYPPRPVCDH